MMFTFAELTSASQRDLQLHRIRRVEGEAGGAAAVEGRADVEPVELHASFVGTASIGVEEIHLGHDLRVHVAALDGGHGVEQRAVRARGGHRLNQLVVEHRLAPRALRVDGRRLAGDRHRLLGADRQVDVDRGDRDAADVHLGAGDGFESREVERELIGAGQQLRDAVLAGAVRHGRSGLLDQDGTAGFDRDTREDAA
jgi:hypothetical protein